MVFRYCFGMIMSVSTLMIFSGAATPSSVVNLSIGCTSRPRVGFRVNFGVGLSRIRPSLKSKSPDKALIGLRLDGLHICVGEAKMVADFVDQHMADDMAQRLLMFGPVVQNRPPIQPDHVGQPGDIVVAP